MKKRVFTRDKEGHYILIEISIQQEDTTIINAPLPNERAIKIDEAKIDRFEKRNKQFYNNSWRASIPIL